MNSEFVRILREGAVRAYRGICLKGLWEVTKNLAVYPVSRPTFKSGTF
jgi:hypothetical protein